MSKLIPDDVAAEVFEILEAVCEDGGLNGCTPDPDCECLGCRADRVAHHFIVTERICEAAKEQTN